jgi:class 3 adenylate cyclase
LVLFASFARVMWAPDYPFGETEEEWLRDLERLEHADASYFDEVAEGLAPSADTESKRSLAAVMRQSGSPGARIALERMNHDIDVRQVLPSVRVPTLVMNRADDDPAIVSGSRYLAEHIPGARHVELPGADHAPSSGDAEPVLREMESFLRDAWEGSQGGEEQDNVLATVLFTDIVGSTETMARLGDRDWRELLEAHHAEVRRQLLRFRGIEMDTAGDGFFARFDGPARAIRCATTITSAIKQLGIDVRAGLHTGECQLVGGKVAGIAVSIGARVVSEAKPGEVLVSNTVKDLVAGSGITFDDRGPHELKGVPGEWRLYAVTSYD